MSLSIVIPVRDEAANLRPLYAELRPVVDALGTPAEIVVVDDASADGSAEVVEALAGDDARVRLVRLPRPSGLSAALLAGFRAAGGDVIVTLDGDLQNDPADIPTLVAALQDADAVFGWRVRRRDGWLRRVSSRVANRARSRVTGDRVHDAGCGLRALRRHCLADVVPFDGMHRFLPALLGAAGHRVAEVPVNHRPRRSGRAHFGVRNRALVTFQDLLGVRWLLSRRLASGTASAPAPRARPRVVPRLAAVWLLIATLIALAPILAGRGEVRTLPPGTRDVTLFPERPAGHLLAIDVHWDAPAGAEGWVVLEGAAPRSESDAMSWRRRVHRGTTDVVWDLTTFPSAAPVRLRLVSASDAAWGLSAPRVDEAYRLHHLTALRGLALAVLLATSLAIARSGAVLAVWVRGRALRRGPAWWAAALGIAGTALALRLHTLELQSFWFDEVLTAIGTRDLTWVLHTPQIFGHPPLHYLVVWALGAGGADEWWLRLPSCLAGVATVVALGALGRRLLGAATGLAAGAALALSPFHVELSQLARPYALFLLLAVLSLAALLRALERNQPRDWLWFSALAATNLYTHYLATQVLALEAVIAVALLVRARGRGALAAAVSFAGIGVLMLPWVPVLTRLGRAQLGRGELSAATLHDLIATVFVPQFLGPGVGATIGLSLLALGMVSLGRRIDVAVVAFTWIVVPPLVIWWVQPAHFIAGRHFAFALPVLMLVVGHGIVVAARAVRFAGRTVASPDAALPRLGAAFAAVVLVVAWGAPSAEALRHYYRVRHGIDWRTVASMLDTAVGPEDSVVATAGALYPLRHYWSLRVADLGAAGFPGPPTDTAPRSWVIAHNGWDRPGELEPWLDAHAVKVGDVPASWSVPGLTIYRLRQKAVTSPAGYNGRAP